MALYTSVVTSKGQLVIPAILRKRYAIRRGTVVSFIEQDGTLILQPVTPEFVKRLRGSLKLKDVGHGESRH